MLMVAMMLAFRGRLERGAWPLFLGALLGCFAASLAYVIYVGVFTPKSSAELVRVLPALELFLSLILLPPLRIMSWLLGAVSGAFFALSRYVLLGGGKATFARMWPYKSGISCQ